MADVKVAEALDKDIIEEVGSILMHNSATAFSKLVKESININTEIKFISVKDFSMGFIFTEELSGIFRSTNSDLFEGFFLKTSMGAEGISVILFHKKHIEKLVGSLAASGDAKLKMNENDKMEILKEFSNITMQAYLNALGRLINENIESTLPIRSKDILGTLYDFREDLKKKKEQKALLIRTTIIAKETGIEGKLIVLLKPETYNNIIRVMRKKSS
jgi:chemotaxis protein CheY-P-specific phosphatase CheC